MQVANNKKKTATQKLQKDITFYLYEKAKNKNKLRVLYKQIKIQISAIQIFCFHKSHRI